MGQLTVRLLGGIDVRVADRQITDFESQKVRALLAYLLAQRARSFSRQHLAALLWPDKPDEAARRNLRQAVYNLKSALASGRANAGPVLSSGSELQIDPELDCWVDVEVFEQARRQGISSGAVDTHYLTAAVTLYRGDFLTGFALKDNLEFEFWQLAEQERLRDLAVDALRVLVQSYLSRGEFRLGLQYARRLVAIDPLSEQAHRYLMQFYVLSDQRSRALAQYDELRHTLRQELGVEPVQGTQDLYQQILKEQTPDVPKRKESKGIGPIIPMVGRHEPYSSLRESWRTVLEGRCRVTIVEGEPGVGKNRLVKSFLDAASSRRKVTILKGHCDDMMPTVYQPFAQVLRNTFTDGSPRARSALKALTLAELTHLAHLIPELHGLRPNLPPAAALSGRQDRERLFESIARAFEQLCRPAEAGSTHQPLVLMLGDLQWAGQETVDLLEHLLACLAAAPIWILSTSQTAGPLPWHRLAQSPSHVPISRIRLDRLGSDSIADLAATVVGDDQAGDLARFLIRHTHGLPLAIAESINSMWDQDILVQHDGQWQLKDSLAGWSGDLDELIQRRLNRLPTSTRRLASQAAVMGRQFDAELLCKAAQEHIHVVEVGLELMLERWLIRQHSDYWMTGRREHDIVLWAQGARRGQFEFNHRLIWKSIVEDVDLRRRRVMHREFAEAAEQNLGAEAERCGEMLAFHFAQAGVWDRAVVYLRQVAKRAHALLAIDTAKHYYDQTSTALQHLAETAPAPGEAQRWRRERARTLSLLDEIDQALTA